MQLNEPSAIDGPQETGIAQIQERNIAATAEQRQRIPARRGRTLCPAFGCIQKIIAVRQKLTPSMRWDISWWSKMVEARDPLDPIERNATCCRFIGCVFNRVPFLNITIGVPNGDRPCQWLT
jgi:hypothetical protein